MKNKLEDLNNHLFAQLERLQDESLKGEDLESEIARAKATGDISRQIIDGGKVALEAQRLSMAYKEQFGSDLKLPGHLGIGYESDD